MNGLYPELAVQSRALRKQCVRIGGGAIVGANSVVGKDVEPYTVVVGNPAKVLRRRFEDELIDLLLGKHWLIPSPSWELTSVSLV